MKVKNVKLEWYALEWSNTEKKTVYVNVLGWMKDDLVREIRAKRVYNKSILREYLKTQLMYEYWRKAEAEFFISDLCGMNYEKVDIWKQLEPNLDKIVDYVNSKLDLKFE